MTTIPPVSSLSYFRARAYELNVHREWAKPFTLKLKTLRRIIYSELAPVRRTVIQDRSNVSVNIYFKQINFVLTSVFYPKKQNECNFYKSGLYAM